MTLQELAKRLNLTNLRRDKTNISPERFVQLDAGAPLTIGELNQIASQIGFKLRDLTRPITAPPPIEMSFRRSGEIGPNQSRVITQLTSKMLDVSSIWKSTQLRGISDFFGDLRTLPASYEIADRMAHRFREVFANGSHGPLSDLPQLAADRVGIVLFVMSSQEIEGAAAIKNKVPFVFLSARKFPPRMLFSLAHEIAHLIAHLGSADFARVDFPGSIGRFGKGVSDGSKESEYFADAFASCLLLPSEGVGVFLKELRSTLSTHSDQISDIEIVLLARYFNVSFQVAARRCESLRLLPTGSAAALYSAIRKQFRNPEKMASDLGLPDREPVRFINGNVHLRRFLSNQVERGEISKGRAEEVLDDSLTDDVAA